LYFKYTKRLNVLMHSLVEAGLFLGYHVGCQNAVQISHLKITDDTLIIGEKSWASVRFIRAMFNLFEDISGLKVNFN